MPSPGEIRPIQIRPGVHPSTDSTETATDHYTYSDKNQVYGWRSGEDKGVAVCRFDAGNEVEGGKIIFF